MTKRLFGLFSGALLALFLQLCQGAETAPPFRFGGRLFSAEEAAKIAALPAHTSLPPNASVKQKIEAQRELIGGIALFAREGIELSVQDTLLEIGGEFLLLEAPARAEFEQKLRASGLPFQEFCQQESQDLRRQFAVAARKWYRKRFAGEDQISQAQVRDWYYRHQTRFLQEELDPERCFMLVSREAVPTVLAMLAQGSGAADVQKAIHALPLPPDTLYWLNKAPVTRESPAPGYTLISDKERILLLQEGAVRKSYRKLDAELKKAIEQALYDALARARLAAALTEELQNAAFEYL